MRPVCLFALSLLLTCAGFASPFVAFPKAGQLVSPDGRFVLRTAEHDGTVEESGGTFRSLWLVEVASGRTRKLCDYWGTAMAGWSGEDFLILTHYMSKRSSRVLLFSASRPDDVVVLDMPTLIRLLPPDSRDTLRQNDHVFIEGLRVEKTALYLRVWGYGTRDVNGFRWSCSYSMQEGTISCREEAFQ